MNDQTENFDNFPILNTFLTTIPEHSPTLTSRESLQPVTKQVDEWYQVQAKMLLAKKERQQLKQNRIKQIQQQFEAQRSKKQREIEQKLASSEKNKTRNLNHIQEKFHKISLRHQKVFIKIQDENLKQLQKNYDSRRAYDIETSRRSSKLINSSQHTSTDERHKSVKDYKTKTLQHEQIRNKMNEIDNRLSKAKTMYKQRQEETVNKVRNHNVFDLSHAQTRAKEHFDGYLKMYATKIMNKMQSAEFQKDKIEKQIEKKNEEKHKSYSEKLKRIHTNLLQLQEQQQMKFQELSKKLQKTNANDKGNREHRETLYQKKFLGNLEHLEREKVERANQIIQKHQEISLKNRLYKEKKQSLIKNLKVEAL